MVSPALSISYVQSTDFHRAVHSHHHHILRCSHKQDRRVSKPMMSNIQSTLARNILLWIIQCNNPDDVKRKNKIRTHVNFNVYMFVF